MSRIEQNRITPQIPTDTTPTGPQPAASPSPAMPRDEFTGRSTAHTAPTPRTHHGTSNARPSAPADPIDRSVSSYVTAMRVSGGVVPSAPQIAPLPEMTGEQVLAQVGERPARDVGRAYREAVEERERLEPHSILGSIANVSAPALQRAGRAMLGPLYDRLPATVRQVMSFEQFTCEAIPSAADIAMTGAELAHYATHGAKEAPTLLEAIMARLPQTLARAEEAAAPLAGTLMQAAGHAMQAYEIANAFWLYGQELNHLCHGEVSASLAVLAGMRDEMALRAAQDHAANIDNAATSYALAMRGAARGEITAPPPGVDRAAWALGQDHGAAYRRAHGDALNRLDQHNRNAVAARAQLDRETAGPFAPTGTFVPLNGPARTTVAATIVIPPG